ncbi:MAG: ABC transporter permease [bacterium]|nr:ABC transporter permease [bacterium]
MIDLTETGKLSLVAIGANKTRSFLTMLGIIIGVSAVILLVSIGAGLQSFINKQFESLGKGVIYVLPGKVGGTGGDGGGSAPSFQTSKLSEREVSAIAKLPEIKAVTGGYQTNIVVKRGKERIYTEINGSSANIDKIRNLDLAAGRSFTVSEEQAGAAVAILGYRVKDELFKQRDPVGKTILLGGKTYTVIGYRKETGGLGNLSADNEVMVLLTTMKRQFNFDKYTYLFAAAKDESDPKVVAKQMERELRKYLDKDDFTVSSQEQLLGTVNQILGVLTAALGGIAAISLLVGGVGIMNIMLVSVTERTREIGLRKAVGAKPADILLQFLIEAVMLSVSGGIIGIAIGVGGSLVLNRFITTTVTPWSVIIAVTVSALVGIIFGVAPAAKASAKDPIEALRYE